MPAPHVVFLPAWKGLKPTVEANAVPCDETRKGYARRKSGAPANEKVIARGDCGRASGRHTRNVSVKDPPTDLRGSSLEEQIVSELLRRRWIGEVYREVGGSGFAQDLFIDEKPSGAGCRVARHDDPRGIGHDRRGPGS